MLHILAVSNLKYIEIHWMGEIDVNLLLKHKFKHCIMCQDHVPQIIGYIWDSDTAMSAFEPRPSRPHWGHPVCVREKAHSEAWANELYLT